MTVKDVILALSRADLEGKVTVECEHMGGGVFNHAIFVDRNIVISEDIQDE